MSIEALARAEFVDLVHLDRLERADLDAYLAAHAHGDVDVEGRRIKLRLADVVRLLVLALDDVDALRRAFLLADLAGHAAQPGVRIVAVENEKREIAIVLRERSALLRILHCRHALLFEVAADEVAGRHGHALENPGSDHLPSNKDIFRRSCRVDSSGKASIVRPEPVIVSALKSEL